MSVKFPTVYVAVPGDTLDSVVSAFRLSSRRALTEIPNNAHLGDPPPGAALATGTRVHIPPNATDLLRERSYALHAVRPMLMSHFDEQQRLAERSLRDAVLADCVPRATEEIDHALTELRESLGAGMEAVARASASLAEIGSGMAATHVATKNDRAVLGSTVGHLTGLYWMLSAQYVEVWAGMWNTAVWEDKWRGEDTAGAWRAVEQYLNTVRSISVQQVDQRLRETLMLERRLLAE